MKILSCKRDTHFELSRDEGRGSSEVMVNKEGEVGEYEAWRSRESDGWDSIRSRKRGCREGRSEGSERGSKERSSRIIRVLID